MNFENKPPEWQNTGTEPTEDIKKSGFQAGYKPPAAFFNWFWSKVGNCIKELQEKLISVDDDKVNVSGGNVSATVAKFTEAEERENISTGETLATIFGKIKKWFADLAAVAFSGSYNDLSDTPENATDSADGLMSSSDKSKLDGIEAGAQVNTVTGVKGSSESNYRKGNINITKANIGLGNVDNTSDDDKPISTAVQEALNGKLDSDDISSDAYDFLDCISEPESLTFKIDGAAFNPYEWNTLAVTTVTVASATSRHASVTDYQCNGANDTEMFQAAINSLPSSGGKITILEGAYTITSPLSVSKSVVFEGMGAGTVINCTNHSFLNNTSDSADITIRDCKFNLTGTLSGADPFIYSAGNLTVENCTISATTSSFAPTENSEEDAGILSSFADYINGRKNVSVTNCKITVTVPSGSTNTISDTGSTCGAFIHNQSLGSRVKVSMCDVSMTTKASPLGNLYFVRSGIVSDCNIVLNNDIQAYTGLYLTSCDEKGTLALGERRQEQNITGCLIYATGKVSYGENYCGITHVQKQSTGTFSGNTVIYVGNVFCNFSTVSGNNFEELAKYSGGNLYFWGDCPTVTGNRIYTRAANTVLSTSDGNIIYTNNMQNLTQTVTTSSTAIIANNSTELTSF